MNLKIQIYFAGYYLVIFNIDGSLCVMPQEWVPLAKPIAIGTRGMVNFDGEPYLAEVLAKDRK
jgi:hypothetical protein